MHIAYLCVSHITTTVRCVVAHLTTQITELRVKFFLLNVILMLLKVELKKKKLSQNKVVFVRR